MLALALIRVGGVKMTRQLLEQGALCGPLAYENRSPSALALHHAFCIRLALQDAALQALVKDMGGGTNGMSSDDVGKGECVYGQITANMNDLGDCAIVVRIPDECPLPLAKCVRGRVARHVDRYVDGEFAKLCPGETMSISVEVAGAGIEPLDRRFRMK